MWEDGKRIRWFNNEELKQINQGKLDYRSFFELQKSKSDIPKNPSFEPPENFDEMVNMIQTSFPDVLK